jgi:hypothetical protein
VEQGVPDEEGGDPLADIGWVRASWR